MVYGNHRWDRGGVQWTQVGQYRGHRMGDTAWKIPRVGECRSDRGHAREGLVRSQRDGNHLYTTQKYADVDACHTLRGEY